MRAGVLACACLALGSGYSLAADLLTVHAGAVPDGPPSLQARLATVDVTQIPDWTVATGKTVQFNLWDGITLPGLVEQASPTDAGRILSGTLADEPDGSFVAVVRDDVLAAQVWSPSRGAWYVHSVGNGLHAVRRINWEGFKTCATDELRPVQPPDGGAAGFTSRDVPEITVMIVYTAEARTGAGGQAGIDSVIDLAIAQANQVYASSQINARLRLVYRGLVNYTESGSASTDIYRLQDPADGFIDEVHPIRNCAGADVVTMMVNNFNACGIGFLMCCGGYQGFESYAVNVVDKDCVPNFTFAHEVGHNLGCHHDRDNAGGSAAFPYSYGYRTPDQVYRTVMAYAPGTRVGFFSNPDVFYQGYRMGVPLGQTGETHNALTITSTAPIAAQFRPDGCPSDIDVNCFVNGDDFDLFTQWFDAGDHKADYDRNSFVNGDDFDAFTADFAAGC